MKITWTEAIQNWSPKYAYERPMIPYVEAIRAANLTLKKVAYMTGPLWGDRNWTHDAMQNVMTVPDNIRAALDAADHRHRARRYEKSRRNAVTSKFWCLHRRY